MSDFDYYGSGLPSKPQRSYGSALLGAGIGVVLAGFLAFGGFKAFLLAILFAVIGGAIGRFWAGES